MKNLLIISLFMLTCPGKAQLLIDSMLQTGPYDQIDLFPGSEGNPIYIYTTHIDDQSSKPFLLRYDDNLNLIDTLTGCDVGRPGGYFTNPFTFNYNLYYFCRDSVGSIGRNFSLHKLQNGIFLDSIDLDLDTIDNAYPEFATVIDNNTLQIIISIYLPNGAFEGSRILMLDSTFNFKSYHNPSLDSIPPTWAAKRIEWVHQINDTTWHLFWGNTIVVYNPKADSVKAVKNILSRVKNTYSLPNQRYLALGHTPIPIAGNLATGLGFYLIDNQTNILDTVRFNAFKDTIPQWGINNYSSELSISSLGNSIVYDTNNIFLAAECSYTKFNTTEDREYFHVVKTDINGTLKWRFLMGGLDNSVIFTGIAPTENKGCIITGEIARPFSTSAILIKLGPDGNISNVELNAPENLVQFYPNPVGDKLKYSYLPDANGIYTLEIIDMNGRPIRKSLLKENRGTIPVDLKTGFYLYQLKDPDGKVLQIGKLQAL